MSVTARALIQNAFVEVGVLGANQSMPAGLANQGLTTLNMMMGQWAIQVGTMPVRVIETFDLVSNQKIYTIGDGGDFDTTRPMRLEGAALVLTQAQPDEVEVPLSLLSDDAYEAIQVKDLANNQPTCVWYQPASPLGKIYLWPVPNVDYNDLRLYFNQQLSEFDGLSTAYDLPPGYQEAIHYNLAKRFCGTKFGRPLTPEIQQQAATSLLMLKRNNIRPNDMPQDIFTGNRRYGYNIQTGTGGGAS